MSPPPPISAWSGARPRAAPRPNKRDESTAHKLRPTLNVTRSGPLASTAAVQLAGSWPLNSSRLVVPKLIGQLIGPLGKAGRLRMSVASRSAMDASMMVWSTDGSSIWCSSRRRLNQLHTALGRSVCCRFFGERLAPRSQIRPFERCHGGSKCIDCEPIG